MSQSYAAPAQHKDAACCLKPILEAAPHKKAGVQPLASYHTNYQSKRNTRHAVPNVSCLSYLDGLCDGR